MKKLTLLLLLLNLQLFAQQEANIWYFGEKAGLDFSNGSPTVLTDGQLEQREGVAVMNDWETGELLFYSEGTRVWDKNHELMPNGFGLEGDFSSTNSAFIIPHSDVYSEGENKNIYYLFTTSKKEANVKFRYSIIDMSLNNGLGDVKEKNIFIADNWTEKIAGIRTCEGDFSWMLTHNFETNDFYAYKISENGFDIANPVISSIGSEINEIIDKAGYIKFSPSGEYLAHVFHITHKVELFKFDMETGKVTELVDVLTDLETAYGVGFSPNDRYLYVSCLLFDKAVYQYEIDVDSPNDTKDLIFNSDTYGYGAMQLGPDGKLYIAKEIKDNGNFPTEHIAVINNPDNKGMNCNFVDEGLDLSPGQTYIGLPSFLAIAQQKITFDKPEAICIGESVAINYNAEPVPQNIEWKVTDLQSGKVIIYLDEELNIIPETSGSHLIELTAIFECNTAVYMDTLVVLPPPQINLGTDTTYCEGDPLILDAYTEGATYEWLDGSTDATFEVTEANKMYWVTVISKDGCSASDTIAVKECETVPVELLDFSGTIRDKGNLLSWITASEIQNISFILEASGDGLYFQQLTETQGANFSSQIHTYHFMDQNPYDEISYYRLLQQDWNGDKKIVGQITLTRNKKLINLDNIYYSNNSDLQITISATQNQDIFLSLFNINGQAILRDKKKILLGKNSFEIQSNHLPKGMYILNIQTGSRQQLTKVFNVY